MLSSSGGVDIPSLDEMSGLDLAAHVVYAVEKACDDEGKMRMNEMKDQIDDMILPENELVDYGWIWDGFERSNGEDSGGECEKVEKKKKKADEYEDPIGKMVNSGLNTERLIEMTDEEWISHLEKAMSEG
jgi:hypothetical protein